MGEYALKADLMTDDEILKDAFTKDRQDDVGNIDSVVRTSWLTEPHFKGALPSTQSSEEDFENISKPLSEQIFFCGEHTNLQYLATTHNLALMSGIRVAEEVIEAKQKINYIFKFTLILYFILMIPSHELWTNH